MTKIAASQSAQIPRIRAVPPPCRRGLNRVEAAGYVGLSPAKFDELVADGRRPGPKKIDSRRVWDVCALDMAFDALSGDDQEPKNPWDRVLP